MRPFLSWRSPILPARSRAPGRSCSRIASIKSAALNIGCRPGSGARGIDMPWGFGAATSANVGPLQRPRGAPGRGNVSCGRHGDRVWG